MQLLTAGHFLFCSVGTEKNYTGLNWELEVFCTGLMKDPAALVL